MKLFLGFGVNEWQQQILGRKVMQSDFNHILLQDGNSFAVGDSLKKIVKACFKKISNALTSIQCELGCDYRLL